MSDNPTPSGDQGGGMSTIDMMSQSPAIRRITRIMLRQAVLSERRLHEALSELPEDKRPSEAELAEGLRTLIDLGWLEMAEEDGERIYRVRLKSKEGSETRLGGKHDEAGQSSMDHLWSVVDHGAHTAETDIRHHERMTTPDTTPRSATNASRGAGPEQPDQDDNGLGGLLRGIFGRKRKK